MNGRAYMVGIGLVAAVAAGCDGGTTDPVAEPVATMTVDASSEYAYVTLGDPATEVSVADASSSTAWDLGFYATTVSLNGGDAGPGGVEAVCLCGNAWSTSEQVKAMTAEGELSAFEAVSAADIPTDEDAWRGDDLVPAIDGWWSYDPAAHVVAADADAVFKVRTAEGTSYAKLRVTGMANATQAHAGEVTLEFAVQPEAGAAMGPVETLTVDVSSGPVYVDLTAGAESDASSWDLLLEGYTIRVNGGVSGGGSAGALPVEESFEAITDASDLQSFLYRGDAFGGVFAAEDPARRWYLYNLEGNHLIYPTYNVYLVRTGEDVYKVQLVSYYGADGTSRQITFRYALLEQ